MCNCRLQNIFCAQHIGADRLHGIKLTGGDLLQCGCMETVIDTTESLGKAARISNVPNVELKLGVVVTLPHIVLLLLVTTKYSYLSDIGVQETTEYSIPKGACSTCYQQNLTRKHLGNPFTIWQSLRFHFSKNAFHATGLLPHQESGVQV